MEKCNNREEIVRSIDNQTPNSYLVYIVTVSANNAILANSIKAAAASCKLLSQWGKLKAEHARGRTNGGKVERKALLSQDPHFPLFTAWWASSSSVLILGSWNTHHHHLNWCHLKKNPSTVIGLLPAILRTVTAPNLCTRCHQWNRRT